MIIGITGFIGSGKDTIADYLINAYEFKRMSFASALKDAVSVIFNWDRNLLEGSTKESREWREQVDEWWSNRLAIPNLTPRWVLQYFGTDVCRKHFHDDIWISSLEKRILQTSGNIVISDCRFPNELNTLSRLKATSIRVERGTNPVWYQHALLASQADQPIMRDQALDMLKQYGIHSSEYSSVGLNYDYIIKNDGTLEELYKTVDSIVLSNQGSSLLSSK